MGGDEEDIGTEMSLVAAYTQRHLGEIQASAAAGAAYRRWVGAASAEAFAAEICMCSNDSLFVRVGATG